MQNDKKWVCVEIPLQVTDILVWATLTDTKLTQRYISTASCTLLGKWVVMPFGKKKNQMGHS